MTAATLTLVDFLRARLDEDEAVARAATQGDWVWSREFVTPPGYHHRTIGPLEPGDADHIARHDPARVLRDVEAKRAILAGIEDADPYSAHITGVFTAWDVLYLLTLPYSDHPDHRGEEWRQWF